MELTPREENEVRRRAAPSRQKQAEEFLKGGSPGVMQRYAPDAVPDPEEGWVESDETVEHKLYSKEEFPQG